MYEISKEESLEELVFEAYTIFEEAKKMLLDFDEDEEGQVGELQESIETTLLNVEDMLGMCNELEKKNDV